MFKDIVFLLILNYTIAVLIMFVHVLESYIEGASARDGLSLFFEDIPRKIVCLGIIGIVIFVILASFNDGDDEF